MFFKLERASLSQVDIRYKKKNPFFTKIFFRALYIACGLHLLALILFKIESSSNDGLVLLPPVRVEADKEEIMRALVVSNITPSRSEGLLYHSLEKIQAKHPKDFTPLFSIQVDGSFALRENLEDDLSFLQIERVSSFTEEVQEEKNHRLNIYLSPNFSDYKIKPSSLENIPLEINEIKEPITSKYRAFLETSSGKLFGITKEGEDKDFDKVLENVLLQLRFEKSRSQNIIDGMIELSFSEGEGGVVIVYAEGDA